MAKPWFQQSLADLEAEARTGDAQSLWRLALAHQRGHRGAARDPARAMELLRQSADAASAIAARRLGDCYVRGTGVVVDRDQGLAWYLRAAELGDGDAQSNLGALVGGAEGERWLRAAARVGQPYAIAELARRGSAAEPGPPGDVLESVMRVDATTEQLDAALGHWLDAIASRWPALEVDALIDGDDVDFPGQGELPASMKDDYDTLEIDLRCDGARIRCDVTWDEDAWKVELSSSPPHPSAEAGNAIADALHAAAAAHARVVD